MKESIKKIRISIMVSAIAWILKGSNTEAFSRKDAVRPLLNNPASQAEAYKKDWQVNLFKRLVDNGHLESGAPGFYKLTSVGRQYLTGVLRNYELYDGVALSTLLWPNGDVVIGPHPAATEVKQVMDEVPLNEEVDAESTAEATEETTEVSMSPELLGVLDALATRMITNHEGITKWQSSMGLSFLTFREDVITNITAVGAAINQHAGQTEKLNTAMIAMNSIADKTMNSSNKRITDMEEKLSRLHQLVEANHTVVKQSTAALTEVPATVRELVSVLAELAGPIRALRTDMTKFNARIETLVSNHEKDESDQVGKLLKKVQASIDETVVLRDELLNLLSDAGDRDGP